MIPSDARMDVTEWHLFPPYTLSPRRREGQGERTVTASAVSEPPPRRPERSERGWRSWGVGSGAAFTLSAGGEGRGEVDRAFRDLARRAHGCRACPRMDAHSAVLGPLNGRLGARVFFIGEAPGRFGSAATRVPFRGDKSGEYFERLLPHAGLDRRDIFITNAVLCNPKDGEGRNDRPAAREVRSCSGYLRELLDLVRPLIVVTLGRLALDALRLIEPHNVVLARDVASACRWRGALLVPLYHPGGRAMARRPFDRQAEDYRRLGEVVSKLHTLAGTANGY